MQPVNCRSGLAACLIYALTTLVATLGCVPVFSREKHELGWNASDFFDDPAVVEWCDAVVAQDEGAFALKAGPEIAKAVGKDGMTPLLWAMMDQKPKAVAALLEQGADPNLRIQRTIGSARDGVTEGAAPIHIAAGMHDTAYLKLLLEASADPNLQSAGTFKETPIYFAITHLDGIDQHLDLLLQHGAELDHQGTTTPVMHAVSVGKYTTALLLLRSGADPSVTMANGRTNLFHMLIAARSGRKFRPRSKVQEKGLSEILVWISQHYPGQLERIEAEM